MWLYICVCVSVCVHMCLSQTIVLSALTREAASKIGFENVKPKQIEAVLKCCKGRDVFVSLLTGYGKTLILTVLPSLFIRQALFSYAASVQVLHPAAQLETRVQVL